MNKKITAIFMVIGMIWNTIYAQQDLTDEVEQGYEGNFTDSREEGHIDAFLGTRRKPAQDEQEYSYPSVFGIDLKNPDKEGGAYMEDQDEKKSSISSEADKNNGSVEHAPPPPPPDPEDLPINSGLWWLGIAGLLLRWFTLEKEKI